MVLSWDIGNKGHGASHSFVEAVAPANTILYVETLNNGNVNYPGFSLALTPIDGGNSGNTYYGNCNRSGFGKYSLEREFTNISWRHTEQKTNWCEKVPSGAIIHVAYSDGHTKARAIGQAADFKEWAVKQGGGDVGRVQNAYGATGCWYP